MYFRTIFRTIVSSLKHSIASNRLKTNEQSNCFSLMKAEVADDPGSDRSTGSSHDGVLVAARALSLLSLSTIDTFANIRPLCCSLLALVVSEQMFKSSPAGLKARTITPFLLLRMANASFHFFPFPAASGGFRMFVTGRSEPAPPPSSACCRVLSSHQQGLFDWSL